MQFLYPGFLWALAFLAIPLIIHLFYFRRFKRVYFTNVRFLKQVQEETSARRRLRNLLVLSMRLLALSMLVLAFAQPFISRKGNIKQGPRAVSIYLDNSFSMQAESSDAALFELARQRARDIVNAYSEEDRFQILTNELSERQHQWLEKEEALSLIEELDYSPETRTLSQILEIQQAVSRKAKDLQPVFYLLSDFQRSITDFQPLQDSSLEVYLVPMQAVAQANVSIDTAWFENPIRALGQTYSLFARLSNYGEENLEDVRLELSHEGETKPAGTQNIPAGKTTNDTVNLTMLQSGWHKAELKVDDYPVQFDDHYYFAFKLDEKLPVLNIYEQRAHPALRKAFEAMPQLQYEEKPLSRLDYSAFNTYKLIILDEPLRLSSGLIAELKTYVAQGGKLLFFPHPQADKASYRSLSASLQTARLENWEEEKHQVAHINTEAFIFREVFEHTGETLRLPTSTGRYRLNLPASTGGEVLLRYRDGLPFLLKTAWGEGLTYICAAPLNEAYSDLTRNAEIFVPMLFRMVLAGNNAPRIAHTIGRDEWLEVEHLPSQIDGEIVYKMAGAEGEFIPEQQITGSRLLLHLRNQVRKAGFYTLYLEKDKPLYVFAFNYDRRESNLRTFSPEDLQRQWPQMQVLDTYARADFSHYISEQDKGISLWRWCLIAALFFLGLEGLILRFFKA